MKKITVALITLFISFFSVKATHIMSTAITYEYVGNDSFDITLSVYRDCNGIGVKGHIFRIKTECKSELVGGKLISVMVGVAGIML